MRSEVLIMEGIKNMAFRDVMLCTSVFKQVPLFRSNLLPLSSSILKMKAAVYSRMLVPVYVTT
jgi:hypothetical protein